MDIMEKMEMCMEVASTVVTTSAAAVFVLLKATPQSRA